MSADTFSPIADLLDGQYTPIDEETAAQWREAGWWENRSIRSLLTEAASRYPDREALVGRRSDGDRVTRSYTEFDANATHAASVLSSLGVGVGDAVVLMLPNWVEYAELVFGINEIMANLANPEHRDLVSSRVTGLLPTRKDLRASIPAILRGTGIGSALGVLPGGGAVLASFASYTLEKRVSRHPQEFGKGAIEGVAGPKSANNAGAQTSFIPMLTLGIPANPVMAILSWVHWPREVLARWDAMSGRGAPWTWMCCASG